MALSSVQNTDVVVKAFEMVSQSVALLLGVDEADDLVVGGQSLQLLHQAALLLVLGDEHYALLNALVLAGVLIAYNTLFNNMPEL